MSAPAEALETLAGELRRERSVLAEHVGDPGSSAPVLGTLVATGPRAAAAPAEYALVVEAVREGYLLHHRESRLLDRADADLALLAGDYLYALGIERLAALGDLAAVRELADLISLAAQLHARGEGVELVDGLWLAVAVAIACGATDAHEQAKRALRANRPGSSAALWDAARHAAGEDGIDEHLEAAAKAIDFGAPSG